MTAQLDMIKEMASFDKPKFKYAALTIGSWFRYCRVRAAARLIENKEITPDQLKGT